MPRLYLLNAAFTALFFGVDLTLPLGIAGGIPYVAVVLLSLWLPGRSSTTGFAIAATLLTAAGAAASPAGAPPWQVLGNRLLAGFAVWVTAGLVLHRKRSESRRRAAEEALADERDFAESLVDTARAIVLVLDRQGGILRFNRYMEEISGFSIDEVRGADWLRTFIPERERGRVRDLFAKAMSGTRTRGNVNPIVTKDGRERLIEWYDTELHDRQGRPVGLLAVGLDVTERRELEAQLLQAQKMEAVGQLAGGIAHDFNNLLTSIRGSNELLLERVAVQGAERRAVDRIQEAVERAAALTQQLLAFGRRQLVRPEVIDLNKRTRQTGELCSRLVGGGVTLELRLDPQGACVEMDPVQLDQILINLVANAKDAMPDGGTIRVESANVDLDGASAEAAGVEPGPYVRLSVEDTGCGMDEEVRARIFEPFFTTKGPGKGTGLGLSTLYGIVREGGGGISVDSAPGHGSRFSVHLPRVAAPGAAAGRMVPHEGHGETLLVVEDDRALRELMVEVLESAGYTVLPAADAREALRLARGADGKIDLAVTDVTMPGMSGPELARVLAKESGGIKLLFISGYTTSALASATAAIPDALFLHKPFSNKVLTAKVREALAEDRSR